MEVIYSSTAGLEGLVDAAVALNLHSRFGSKLWALEINPNPILESNRIREESFKVKETLLPSILQSRSIRIANYLDLCDGILMDQSRVNSGGVL